MNHPNLENHHSRTNLLAFPNQTAVSFWIIVSILLGIMLVGAIGPSPVLMWPATLTMFLLPVRAWLTWPDRELKNRQNLTATQELIQDGTLPRLQQTLTTLAQIHGCPHPIKIIISGPNDTIHAVGSRRRHYLFMGQDIARKLDNDLQDPKRQAIARAALLHELAHFLHKDVQRVGYTRELLDSSFWLILWWMVFLLGWLGFANLTGRAFLEFDISQVTDLDPLLAEVLTPIVTLSPEGRAELIEQIESVNIGLVLNDVVVAFTPIIAMGLFLRVFFWHRMLRVQEHYADYFVVTTMNDVSNLRKAWLEYAPSPLTAVSSVSKWQSRVKQLWRKVWFRVNDALPERTRAVIQGFQKLFRYHPTFEDREVFLLNPLGVYSAWWAIAAQILALVLALEIAATTPLIGYYLGATYIIHFATIAVFIMLANWMLPLLIEQQSVKKAIEKSLGLIYGVRLAWITLTFALLLVLAFVLPDYTLGILNSIVFAGGRFAGNPTSVPIDNPAAITLSIMPSYFGVQILSLVAAALLLWVYVRLIRQVIKAGMAVNWQTYHRNRILVLSLAALTLLTPLSDIIQGYFDNLISPMRLLSYAIGVACIIWLIIWGRRVL